MNAGRAGDFRGTPDVVVGGVRPPVRDVVPYRVGEEERVLEDDARPRGGVNRG